MNRSKLHNGGKYVRLRQFKSFDVGVQVSYRVDTKIQTEKAVCIPIRDDLGQEIRRLAACRECRVLEGHMMIDHVHMLIEMPPKYSIAQVMGYIKGKSAIYIARKYGDRTKYFSGQHFWARGYFVSTVGRNEEAVRKYIQNQEAEDVKLDQDLGLFPEL